MTPSLSDGNRGVFESRAVADEYESRSGTFGLFEPEKVILGRLVGEFAGGTLLDVGVGTGRTTPALSAACRRYSGIDYAQAMVDRCRRLFPNLDFRQQDARDLSAFEPQSFDAVWFSFNGIDYVPPEDRGQVLRECSRVLRPGGALVFSSHNLHAPPRPPTLFPEWRREGHPVRRQLSNLRRLFRHVGHHVNYRARKAHERSGDGQQAVRHQAPAEPYPERKRNDGVREDCRHRGLRSNVLVVTSSARCVASRNARRSRTCG